MKQKHDAARKATKEKSPVTATEKADKALEANATRVAKLVAQKG